MEAVRRTVELGRAARAQAKVKVRQPLRRAVIVANDAERAAIEAQADLVTAELNVKELDFVSEESELVTYRVKPNYRTLGPALRQADAAGRRRGRGSRRRPRRRGDRGGRARSGSASTARTTRSAEEISLVMEPLEGYQVEAEAGHAVALQLELDEELRREGLAREIVHAVQNARSDAGPRGLRPDRAAARRRRGAARGRPRAPGLRRRRDPRHRGRLRRRRARRDRGDDRRPRAQHRGQPQRLRSALGHRSQLRAAGQGLDAVRRMAHTDKREDGPGHERDRHEDDPDPEEGDDQVEVVVTARVALVKQW